MAAPLGVNQVGDAGMDDPDDWTGTEDPPEAIAEIANGEMYIFSGAGAPLASLTSLSCPGAVVDQEYEIRHRSNHIAGTYRLVYGGETFTYSSSGIHAVRFVAPAGGGLGIARHVANTEVYIDWVSVRKVNVAMSSLIMEMRDFDGDKKQFSLELGVVSDGASYDTESGLATTLAAAINDVVAGNNSSLRFVATESEPDDTDASAFLAQAHIRWIIEYKDATTGDGPYQIAIPCPDLGDDTLVLAGSNHYDPADAKWVTLIAAMEGEVKNPRTGNDITIQDIFLEE